MHMIEIATGLLVLIILVVIYRRPVTVLLPLITIGVSVGAAQGVVSALTHVGLGISALTTVLMTAMIVGAGTDYAVFLISRYHEYTRSGIESDVAVQKALSSIGKVIAASAATVAVTFLGMMFTKLPAFTSVGPALAVSIAMAFFAAVTLLPAILVLAGRRGWIAPRQALTDRFWQRSAVNIVRRPKSHLVVSLAMLLALGACALMLHPTYNDRISCRTAPRATSATRRWRRISQQAPCCPSTSTSTRRKDLRTPQALADMEQMAQRVAQLPNVAAVRGVTRPTGQPLDQAKISYQAGQVGSKLEDVSTQISSRTNDLDALSNGAHQLADSLAKVRDQINGASKSMTAMTSTLSQVQQQLAGSQATQLLNSIQAYANNAGTQTAMNNVANSAAPMLAALNNSSQCDADAACSAGRTKPAAARVRKQRPDPGVGSERAGDGAEAQHADAIGEQQSAVGWHHQSCSRTTEDRADAAGRELAGRRQQAIGRRCSDLVDQTKKMGVGMNQAADLLMSMKRDASDPSMAGMYIPPQVLTTNDFKNAAKLFISPDGHSARYLVESKFDPFSTAGDGPGPDRSSTLRGARSRTRRCRMPPISMVGTTPMYSAIRSYYDHDLD